MTFEQFEKKTVEYLNDVYGDEADVIVMDVTKNNGMVLRGVTVRFEDAVACPTVYIDGYFEKYCAGKTFASLMDELCILYDSSRLDINFDVSFLDSYETLKDRVLCKLINTEKNKELLMDVPHVDYLDLSAVFYVLIQNDKVGNGTVLLHNCHIKELGVDVNTLFEDARRNTREQLGSSIAGIEDVLLEMIREKRPDVPPEIEEDLVENLKRGLALPLFILTNKYKVMGAACMLDNEILENFSDSIKADFYIVPSSIHELILIPVSGKETPEELNEMVREVNATQVPPDEILSNNVYRYFRETKEIKKC